MNYEDILPDNWFPMMRESNRTHLNRISRIPPFIRMRGRPCLDGDNMCPAKRQRGRCLVSHCILRYPTEQYYAHFR